MFEVGYDSIAQQYSMHCTCSQFTVINTLTLGGIGLRPMGQSLHGGSAPSGIPPKAVDMLIITGVATIINAHNPGANQSNGRCCCLPPGPAHPQKERRAVYIIMATIIA